MCCVIPLVRHSRKAQLQEQRTDRRWAARAKLSAEHATGNFLGPRPRGDTALGVRQNPQERTLGVAKGDTFAGYKIKPG